MGLDQIDQCLPWHHCLHLRKKLLALGLLLGAVVSSSSEKPSCLPPINPVLACDYKLIFAQTSWVSRVSLAKETIHQNKKLETKMQNG